MCVFTKYLSVYLSSIKKTQFVYPKSRFLIESHAQKYIILNSFLKDNDGANHKYLRQAYLKW